MPLQMCPDCDHRTVSTKAQYCSQCGQPLQRDRSRQNKTRTNALSHVPDSLVEEEFKALALDEVDIGLTIIDTFQPDEPIIYANQAYLSMTGYSRDEILGKNARILRGPKTDSEKAREIEEAIEQGQSTSVKILNYTKVGEPFWNFVRVRPLNPDLEQPRYFLGVEEDITEMKQLNQKLEKLSRTDSLTGLDNKREFTRTLTVEWNRAHREKEALSLCMLDLDRFKNYNDHYGHVAGDDVLEAVGETINQTLKRPADRGARFGGEEFAIILPKTGEEGAFDLAEQIRENFQGREIEHTASDVEGVITLSGGVASMIPGEKNQEETLIERADQALYCAKTAGRNLVKRYSSVSSEE